MKKLFEIKAEGNKATVRLLGNITLWKNSSNEFQQKMDDLLASDVTSIELYMSGYGGSLLEANEIANIFIRFMETGGELGLTVGAVAASALTAIIARLRKAKENLKVRIHANGQFMIHNARGGIHGTIKEFKSYIKLMENLEKTMVDDYVASTGLKEKVIIKMMDDETWMSAQEALDKGFVTGIIQGNASDVSNSLEDIMNCGYSAVPKVLNQTKKQEIQTKTKIEMDLTQINAVMGTSFKDEGEAITALATLRAENARLKAEQEQRTESEKNLRIDNVVNAAVEAKKILPAQKATYVSLLKADFDTAETLLKDMKPVAKISDQIITPGADGSDPYANFSFDDFMEKAPEALEKEREEKTDRFLQIFKAHYGVDYEG